MLIWCPDCKGAPHPIIEDHAVNIRSCVVSRFATAIAATMLCTTAASAYSDAAVKDAREVVAKTLTRYHYGEVTEATLALARYYLLEMQFKAGQMPRAAFCVAAKPDLDAVVKEFQEGEGQQGQKQIWQSEIAAMATSEPQCQKAIDAAASLLFGETDNGSSADAVTKAQQVADATVERFKVGEVTSVDVAEASYDLLAAQYQTKQISRADYCQGAVPQLQKIVTGVVDEESAGERTLADEIGAKRKLFAVKALCAG
jgi:hypothetical protein